MNLLTGDFETFFGADYTLKGPKGLSTSEYVRDPRFKAHGAAFKHNNAPAFWVTHNDLHRFLASIDWENTLFIAHHSQFDGFILSDQYNIFPKEHSCTLSLSRVVHQGVISNDLGAIAEHYGIGVKGDELNIAKDVRDLSPEQEAAIAAYSINDVELTFKFWKIAYPQIPAGENDLIDLTVQMFTDPRLLVNIPRAQQELTREILATEELISNCGMSRETLASNAKFAEALIEMGYVPPTKLNKKGERAWAFAKNDIPFQNFGAGHPELANIISARLAVKSTITETRASRLINHCPPGKYLPIYLLYSGAHTWRWSGGDKLNPQNFKRKSELRKSIIAPPGYALVVLDQSQIEARDLAVWAKQKDLIQAFRDERDIYSEFASDHIYHRHIDRKLELPDGSCPDFLEGFVGKVSILGLGYGMGSDKFRTTLASGSMGATVVLPEGQEFDIVNAYRKKYDKIVELWAIAQRMLSIMAPTKPNSMFATTMPREMEWNGVRFREGEVILPNGTSLKYPDLHGDRSGNYSYRVGNKWVYIYGGLLVENIIQKMSRDIIAEQMLAISRRYKVVLSTHDEIVYLARLNEAKEALAFGITIMTQPPAWCPTIPLAVEGGYAEEYSK